MPHAGTLSLVDLPPLSARRVPRPGLGDGWKALADTEVIVLAVEAELEAMDCERVGVHRCGGKPDLILRRRLIGLIWMLTFGAMQWRIAGWLSGVPFTTLHSSFARWTRLGCGAAWDRGWPSTVPGRPSARCTRPANGGMSPPKPRFRGRSGRLSGPVPTPPQPAAATHSAGNSD
jgi:hypothetical protein